MSGDVKRQIVDRGVAQLAGGGQTFPADRLLDVLDDHLVDALLGSLAGLAEADGRAGQRLKLQGHVFEDMALIRAEPEALEEPPPFANATTVFDHAGHPAFQTFVEAGDDVRGLVFQLTQIDPSLQHRKVCPDIWSTKR